MLRYDDWAWNYGRDYGHHVTEATELPEGATGRVENIDDDGDAYIAFDSEELGKQWVLKNRFYMLTVTSQAPS